jgi:hypothetical protein
MNKENKVNSLYLQSLPFQWKFFPTHSLKIFSRIFFIDTKSLKVGGGKELKTTLTKCCRHQHHFSFIFPRDRRAGKNKNLEKKVLSFLCFFFLLFSFFHSPSNGFQVESKSIQFTSYVGGNHYC